MSAPAAPAGDDTRRSVRPGWIELLAGLAVLEAFVYGFPALLAAAGVPDRSPVTWGLFLAALSGVAGLAGFAAAYFLRVRNLAAFGVRRPAPRWVWIGIAGGAVAWVLARLGAVGYYYLAGGDDIQAPYREAAQGGAFSVVLSILFLAVLTPIGEEFLFRGVVATALLRYGALAGVAGSALIFALLHGFNSAFVTALVVGLIAAELRRRSDSVWPGVLTHVVNNLIGQLIIVIFT
jgi:uncharacterized protein